MPSAIVDHMSTITDDLAARVRELRAGAGLSLEGLAGRCGVSRSMLSQIERGESSPTAVVLDRIASGLGVPLASLFDPPAAPPLPVVRAADRAPWRDPSSGYVRTNISPPGYPSPFAIVEVELPAGADVAYDNGPHLGDVHQQVWVREGTLELTADGSLLELAPGDCAAMTLGAPTRFRNPGAVPARYAVVIATPLRAAA